MSIVTRPYETLIRHNRNTVNGQPVDTIAAHHVRIKEYFDDEEDPPLLVTAKLLDPQPISGAGLESVLGAALVTANAQATIAVQERQAALAALAAEQSHSQQLQTTLDQTEQQRATVAAQAAALTQQVQTLQARVAELEAQAANPPAQAPVPQPEPTPAPEPIEPPAPAPLPAPTPEPEPVTP